MVSKPSVNYKKPHIKRQQLIDRVSPFTGKDIMKIGSATANKYAGSNNIDEVAWYSSNSGNKTRPVGGKKPNELGFNDMSGNVWEWCSDWYGDYSSGSQTNPQGPASGSYRVLRGGSWGNGPRSCRVAFRGSRTPDYRGDGGGFRLASSP